MKKLNLLTIVLLSAGVFVSEVGYAKVSLPPVIQLGGLTVNHASSTQPVTTGKLDASALGSASLEYIINCQYSINPNPTDQNPAVIGFDRGDQSGIFINEFSLDGIDKMPGQPFGVSQNSGKIMIDGVVQGASPQLVFYNFDAQDNLTISDCMAQLKYSTAK